jgi:hypothetical protein
MPEETTTGTEQHEEEAEAPASGIVHEDIMQRLLEYQRQLREGVTDGAAQAPERPEAVVAEATTATKTEDVEVVDITAAEAELEAAAVGDGAAAVDDASRNVEIAEVEAREAVEVEPIASPEVAKPTEELFSTPAPSTPPRVWAETSKATPAAPAAEDLGARVAALEDALARVSSMVAELRASFQDMAIAADERLATIEETLAGVGSLSQN